MATQHIPRLVKDAESFSTLTAELLRQGTTVRFRASGVSMRPFIRHGDMLTVVPVKANSLQTGEVVLYDSSFNGITAHRVVSICQEKGRHSFLIRGDATGGAFERVFPEQILGRVAGIHRGDRWIPIRAPHHRLAPVAWAHMQTFKRRALVGASRVKQRILGSVRARTAEPTSGSREPQKGTRGTKERLYWE